VRWGVAGNIAIAWVLTLPAAGAIGAATYAISELFGSGALGPLLIFVSALWALLAVFGRRAAHGVLRPPREDAAGAAAR